MKREIVEKIKQRRLQILVHSCIYYVFDTNIISDAQWNTWAKELVELQRDYPAESKKAIRYDEFEKFDGSTGFDLPVNDEWVMNKAVELLEYKGDLKYSCNPKSQAVNGYYMPSNNKEKSKKKASHMQSRRLF